MSLRTPNFAEALAVSHSQGRNSGSPGLWPKAAFVPMLGNTGSIHDVGGSYNHVSTLDASMAWGPNYIDNSSGERTTTDATVDYCIDGDIAWSLEALLDCSSKGANVGYMVYLSGGGTPGRWQFLHDTSAGRLKFVYYDSGSGDNYAYATVSEASFLGLHHWIVTRAIGGVFRFYRDGVFLGQDTEAAPWPCVASQEFRIGFDCIGKHYKVAIYNKTLALDEIQQLYHDPLVSFRRAALPIGLRAPAVGFTGRSFVLGGGVT